MLTCLSASTSVSVKSNKYLKIPTSTLKNLDHSDGTPSDFAIGIVLLIHTYIHTYINIHINTSHQ
jgi:hypothetical protein